MFPPITARPQGLPQNVQPQNPNRRNPGDDIADLGASLQETLRVLGRVRTAVVEDRNENDLRRARVEVATGLGKIRADTDESVDHEGLGQVFEARAEELRAEIAQRFEGDDKLAKRFETLFLEVAAPHKVAVYGRERRLGADAARAALSGQMNDLLVEFGRAETPSLRDAIAEQAVSHLIQARDNGLITDEQREAAHNKFVAGTHNAIITEMLREQPAALADALRNGFTDLGPAERQQWITRAESAAEVKTNEHLSAAARDERAALIGILSENPARLIDTIDNGAYPVMAGEQPDQLARYRAWAQRALEQDAAAAAGEAEAARTRHEAQLKGQVDFLERALKSGMPLPGIAPDLIAEIADSEQAARFDAILAADGRLTEFRGLPHSQRGLALTARRATPAVADAEIAELKLMEAIDTNLRKREEADPIGLALERGWVAPIASGTRAELGGRLALAQVVADEYEVAPRFFSAAEHDALVRTVRDGTPDDQLSFILTYTQGLGEGAELPLSEIGLEEPVFAYAGMLTLATGDTAAAHAMLTGRSALKEGTVARPGQTARAIAIAETGMIEALGDDQGVMRNRLIEAAIAHYAGTLQAARGDAGSAAALPEQVQADGLARSIQAVTGASVRDGVQYGGIQDVGGMWSSHKTLLPPGVTADQVENALENATAGALQSASRTGAMPRFGNGAVDAGDIEDFIFRYDGAGYYLLGQVIDGRFEALADDTAPDGLARIHLGAFLRAVEGDQ